MQSCGVRRAEQVSLDTADCAARNAWKIGVMCEARGLAARLQRAVHVLAVHTVGAPPLLLLGMRRQAEEVLDGPASQGRACKSRAGLLWGKDHARSVRAMRSRGVEPTLRRLRRRCHLTGSSNGGEPVRTWICTFARIKMSQTSRQFSQSSVIVLLTRTQSLYCMP